MLSIQGWFLIKRGYNVMGTVDKDLKKLIWLPHLNHCDTQLLLKYQKGVEQGRNVPINDCRWLTELHRGHMICCFILFFSWQNVVFDSVVCFREMLSEKKIRSKSCYLFFHQSLPKQNRTNTTVLFQFCQPSIPIGIVIFIKCCFIFST